MQCLKSLIAQSLSPDEVIIVDASDTEYAYLKIKEEFPKDSRFKYFHTKPALTYQRNIGVRNSSGDIIFFLDDDTVLDKDFIKEIVKVFEKDSDKKIGGVMGNIVNIERPKTVLRRVNANLRLLFRHIFLLPSFGDGRFKASSCPTFVHGADEVKNVEFLSGGLTAYRREVFKDLKFDEDYIEAHFYSDDDDFSYRVSRKFQNVYTPYAKIVHKPSQLARVNHYARAKMTVKARYYMLKKNFPQTLKHTLAFWWSVVGLFIQAITTMDKESVKGLISGVTDIKKGRLHKILYGS